MNFWRFGALLLLCVFACDAEESNEGIKNCDDLCRDLSRCSLIPSMLGAGDRPEENCEQRCRSSLSLEDSGEPGSAGAPTNSASAVTTCVADASNATDWACEAVGSSGAGGAAPREPGACDLLRSCLLAAVVNPQVVGSAMALLQFLQSSASASAACPPDYTGDSFVSAVEWCDAQGVVSVRVIGDLGVASDAEDQPTTCREFFETPLPLGTVLAGLYRPAVEVRKADECFVIVSSEQLARAGQEATFSLVIPDQLIASRTVLPCEGAASDPKAREEACSDENDGDGDGLQDCAEPDCMGAQVCARTIDTSGFGGAGR